MQANFGAIPSSFSEGKFPFRLPRVTDYTMRRLEIKLDGVVEERKQAKHKNREVITKVRRG